MTRDLHRRRIGQQMAQRLVMARRQWLLGLNGLAMALMLLVLLIRPSGLMGEKA